MKNKNILIALAILVIAVGAWFWINALTNKNIDEVVSSDPCDRPISRENTVREIEQFIWDCEIQIEQTWIDYDSNAKAHEIAQSELKKTNDTRRQKIKSVREQIMGNSQAPEQVLKKG